MTGGFPTSLIGFITGPRVSLSDELDEMEAGIIDEQANHSCSRLVGCRYLSNQKISGIMGKDDVSNYLQNICKYDPDSCIKNPGDKIKWQD